MRVLSSLLSLAAVAFADIESGQLVVNSPKTLADLYNSSEGAIPMKPAMFGIQTANRSRESGRYEVKRKQDEGRRGVSGSKWKERGVEKRREKEKRARECESPL